MFCVFVDRKDGRKEVIGMWVGDMDKRTSCWKEDPVMKRTDENRGVPEVHGR